MAARVAEYTACRRIDGWMEGRLNDRMNGLVNGWMN